MTVKETGLTEYAQTRVRKLTMQLAVMDAIIEKTARELLEDTTIGINRTRDLVRLTQAIKNVDDLARRAAGMPVNFKSAEAAEPEFENEIFILGTDDDGS